VVLIVITSVTCCFTTLLLKLSVVFIGDAATFVLDMLATKPVPDVSAVVPATFRVTTSTSASVAACPVDVETTVVCLFFVVLVQMPSPCVPAKVPVVASTWAVVENSSTRVVVEDELADSPNFATDVDVSTAIGVVESASVSSSTFWITLSEASSAPASDPADEPTDSVAAAALGGAALSSAK